MSLRENLVPVKTEDGGMFNKNIENIEKFGN